ncbi:MAG: amidohydrolase [Phyllobacteriaceae bacterium]|nr:amidohydrolase [Phyllobacteriaceae bacterium]
MGVNADIVIDNATVLTMDPANPRAEAIAIAGNRIVAVGTSAGIARLKTQATRVFDAHGATVLPGFIESHMHLFPGATQLDSLNLAGLTGFDAIAAAVRRRAAERPDEKLILAEQAQYAMFGEGTAIDRHVLDRILPDRMLAFYAADHHTIWANTKALETTGLLAGAKAPAGSEIVLGLDGKANGELREFQAYEPIVHLTPTGGREGNGLFSGRALARTPTAAERAHDIAALKRGLDYCASLGITSFHNMDGDPWQLELLDEIDRTEGLKARAYIPFRMMPDMDIAEFSRAVEERSRYAGERLKTGFVKMFMDGVLESTTAFMLDDYGGHPGVKGEALFGQEQFEAICVEADRLGLQIAVHAIGDAAVRRTLDGYAAARKANGVRDSRHRIEHIETLDPADLPRFAELGVVASIQPTHAPGDYFPPGLISNLIGEKRLRLAYAWQTIRDTGVRLCFASDWPVAPLDPLYGVRAALTRTAMCDGAAAETQSLGDTLASFTRDGAFVEFAENDKGMLRPGMLADVVVLDGDIENAAPEEVDRLKVRATICDGRFSYEA